MRYYPPIHIIYTQDENGKVLAAQPAYGFFDPMGRGFIDSFDFDKEKQLIKFSLRTYGGV